MAEPPLMDVQTFGGQHRWAVRYLIDWRAGGRQLHPIQLYSTLLRWFHTPLTRQAALTRATAWYSPGVLTVQEPLQTTLDELLNCNVRIGPGYDADAFASFLVSLRDGDLVNGGSYDPAMPKDWAKIRPAFPWILTRWRRRFENVPMPWPFFVFPGPNHPSPAPE